MPRLQIRYRILVTAVLCTLFGLTYLGVMAILQARAGADPAFSGWSGDAGSGILLLFSVALAVSLAFFHWIERWYHSHIVKSEMYIDPLTGAWNRRAAEADLAHLFRLWETRCVNSAVYLLDVDDFKRINDQWGHGTGDVVLQRIVAQLRTVLRGADKVYRWGGEEFVVLCEGAAGPDGRRMGMAIVEAVAASLALPSLKVTASVGMTAFFGSDRQCRQALDRADRAMYHAKRAGKNCLADHVAIGAPVIFRATGRAHGEEEKARSDVRPGEAASK